MAVGSTTDPTIEERLRELEWGVRDKLATLERDNARLRRDARWSLIAGSVALALGLLFLLVPGFGISRRTLSHLSVRELRLVDGNGTVRGQWTVASDGADRLVMKDERGIARLKMSVLADGAPGLVFANEKAL